LQVLVFPRSLPVFGFSNLGTHTPQAGRLVSQEAILPFSGWAFRIWAINHWGAQQKTHQQKLYAFSINIFHENL
jgi:hypothetical protein